MKFLNYSLFCMSTLVLMGCSNEATTNLIKFDTQKEKVQLGKTLFFDKNLSKNRTQSCATCHNPEAGFVDDRDNGVGRQASLGDDGHSLGDRQTPSVAYAMFSPKFHYNSRKRRYIGGQFWDGRKSTLADQAEAPPINPSEMGMSSKEETVQRIQENIYYVESFTKIYGNEIFSDTSKVYFAMAEAIENFERTKEFAPFDSKYDRYLEGKYDLSRKEDLGRSLFFSNGRNSCASCHSLKGEGQKGETFTSYEFHNIGIPINHELRVENGMSDIDLGLLSNPAVSDRRQRGKFKVPTLRNVAVTSPYMHNGIFKELTTVVEFYNKYNKRRGRINPETLRPWEKPEVQETISLRRLKSKRLNRRKIQALVAFMKLLTDKRYEHLVE